MSTNDFKDMLGKQSVPSGENKKTKVKNFIGDEDAQENARKYMQENAQEIKMQGKKRVNSELDIELHTQLKTYSAKKGKSMLEVASLAFSDFMRRNP